MASTVSAALPVSIQDFLQILVAQLNYQDPMKPLDPETFVTQLAQFTSLQQTQQINDNVTSLLTGQGAMQSVGLLGKTIDFTNSSGPQSGSVSAMAFDANGQPTLTVTLSDGSLSTGVTLASLTSIH